MPSARPPTPIAAIRAIAATAASGPSSMAKDASTTARRTTVRPKDASTTARRTTVRRSSSFDRRMSSRMDRRMSSRTRGRSRLRANGAANSMAEGVSTTMVRRLRDATFATIPMRAIVTASAATSGGARCRQCTPAGKPAGDAIRGAARPSGAVEPRLAPE